MNNELIIRWIWFLSLVFILSGLMTHPGRAVVSSGDTMNLRSHAWQNGGNQTSGTIAGRSVDINSSVGLNGGHRSTSSNRTVHTEYIPTLIGLPQLKIRYVQSDSNVVKPGTENIKMELLLENTGDSTVKIDTAVLDFNHASLGDVTDQYNQVPLNLPTTLSAHDTKIIDFQVDVDSTADTGQIELDGRVVGSNPHTGKSASIYRAQSTDKFTVSETLNPQLTSLEYKSHRQADTVEVSGTWDRNVDMSMVGPLNRVDRTDTDQFSGIMNLQHNTTNKITISGTGASGNVYDTTIEVIHDTVPPTINLNAPASDTVGSADVLVSGSIDGESVTLNGTPTTVDGDGNFGRTIHYSVPKDTVTKVQLNMSGTDAAGNTTTRSKDLWIDLEKPDLTLTDPSDTSFRTSQDTLPVGGFWDEQVTFTINGKEYSVTKKGDTYAFGENLSLAEGSNRFVLRGEDKFGHSDTKAIEVLKDTTEPLLDIIFPPDDYVADNQTITIEGQTDTDGVNVVINSTPVSVSDTGYFTLTTTLDTGSNVFDVTAEDSVGNQANTTFEVLYGKNGQVLISEIETSSKVLVGQDSADVTVKVSNPGETDVTVIDTGVFLELYDDKDRTSQLNYTVVKQNNIDVVKAGDTKQIHYTVSIPDTASTGTVYGLTQALGKDVSTGSTTRDTGVFSWRVETSFDIDVEITNLPESVIQGQRNRRVQVEITNNDTRLVSIKSPELLFLHEGSGDKVDEDYRVGADGFESTVDPGETESGTFVVNVSKEAKVGLVIVDASIGFFDSRSGAIFTVDTKDEKLTGWTVLTLKPRVEIKKNYPNPADPRKHSIKINYKLGQPSEVTFQLFTLTGQLVRSRTFEPGQHGGQAGTNVIEWLGRNDSGRMVASGGYFYRIIADPQGSGEQVVDSGKIAILKD